MKFTGLIGAGIVAVAFASAALALEAEAPRPVVIPQADYIRFPLPPGDEKYAVDEARFASDIESIVAISRQSKKDGNQYWGRIAGTRYDRMSSDYVAKRFKEIGLSDIRRKTFRLPAQWMAKSWRMSASIGGEQITLETAVPIQNSSGGLVDAEAIWLGLGTEADFLGRDVKGKAVLLHIWPTPGGLNHSGTWMGAIKRAMSSGAAAVILVSGFPGNHRHHLVSQPPGSLTAAPMSQVPGVTIGQEDGGLIRTALEKGERVRVRLSLDVKMEEGLSTQNVWATLPGMSDEVVLVMAHHDAYFDGALDNASGMAMMLAIAGHYAKLPKEQRKRTMMFVDTSAHHTPGNSGPVWIRENEKALLAKTAFVVNCEHPAQTQIYFWGPRLVTSNMDGARRWHVEGSRAFRALFTDTMRKFGVALYSDEEAHPGGELHAMGEDVPSFHLLDHIFYHTEMDRPEFVPVLAAAKVTSAYLKVIDEANGMTRDALR